MSLFNKLKNSLRKTRSNVSARIQSVVHGRKGLTENLLEELEEVLITADIGVETTMMLIDALREKLKNEKEISFENILNVLKEEIRNDLEPIAKKDSAPLSEAKPCVILVVGVNGTGKTTSIGKLAHYYKKQNKDVLLAAGDTFRAAAIEQLEVWKKRVGVDLIKNKEGTDPAAVAFDAAQSALARNTDILIVDTAGRIHTNVNLMQELSKIKRVVGKVIPGAPHKTLLVIDANMGQNAISQAKMFTDAIDVDGIFLSKLDGTAKGGAVIPIMKNLQIPIEFIGIGEQMDDMQMFNIVEYTEALFSQ